MILRTTPQGRKQDRPGPVQVTKPFMLTQMNWGEGEQVECVLIISIFKNLVLKILEEIRDSRQTRNEILTELGRIGKFLRNYSH